MNINLESVQTKIASFFERYHFLTFFVIIIMGMSFFVYQTYSIITASDKDSGYKSSSNDTSFDQPTVDKLRGMTTSGDNTKKLDFSNRYSPF